MANNIDIEQAERLLDADDNYKVLRRLPCCTQYNAPDGTPTKLGIYLDLETTGLDPNEHEIIELAMVPFQFSADGRIFEVGDAFDQLQEPKLGAIPEEITRLTGITDEMVKGQSIDVDEVTNFVAPASLIIAHNAGFDRKFAEKQFDVFSTKAWACSVADVPWRDEGYEGAKLEYLGLKHGFFYDGHRAEIDCRAGLELLSQQLPISGDLALSVLLENARQSTARVWAENSPFDFKDILKARGYRWNDGNNGKPKSWYRDVRETELDDELAYLRDDIYQRDADIPVVKFNAFDRYSVRV